MPSGEALIKAIDSLKPLVPQGSRIVLRAGKEWFDGGGPNLYTCSDRLHIAFRFDDGAVGCQCKEEDDLSGCDEPFYKKCLERDFFDMYHGPCGFHNGGVQEACLETIANRRSNLKFLKFQNQLGNILNEPALLSLLYALYYLDKERPIYSFTGDNDDGHQECVELWEWLFPLENEAESVEQG
jgi:hypothetical protein